MTLCSFRSIKALVFAVVCWVGCLGNPEVVLAQTAPVGPLVFNNRAGIPLTVSDLQYRDRSGTWRSSGGSWKVESDKFAYLLLDGEKLSGSEVQFSVATNDGKTVKWGLKCSRLDKDGDFIFTFNADNLVEHRRLLAKGTPPRNPPAASTPEQVERAIAKAIGALVSHAVASSEPQDFLERIVVEAAKKTRDELIASAIDDAFPQLTAQEARTVRVMVILALDDKLTPQGLEHGQRQAWLQDELRKKNPDMAAAAEVAQFLSGIIGSRR